MKKYKYDFVLTEDSEQKANKKMEALSAIANRFSSEELEKIAHIVNNPTQLAILKSRLT